MSIIPLYLPKEVAVQRYIELKNKYGVLWSVMDYMNTKFDRLFINNMKSVKESLEYHNININSIEKHHW